MTLLNPLICITLLAPAGDSTVGTRRFTRDQQNVKLTSKNDLPKLVKDLGKAGATVKLSRETVSQPFFSARGRIIYINGESVWIFGYLTSATADKDAAQVSRDGMTIGNHKPSWLGTPHFFRRPRMIILYLGDDAQILKSLSRTLGQQFAGG